MSFYPTFVNPLAGFSDFCNRVLKTCNGAEPRNLDFAILRFYNFTISAIGMLNTFNGAEPRNLAFTDLQFYDFTILQFLQSGCLGRSLGTFN